MIRVILYSVFLLMTNLAVAQVPYFSNYLRSDITLNPASVASRNIIGVTGTHRIQRYNSGVSLQTTNIQLQYALLDKALSKRWGGVGLSAESDRVTEGRPYTYFAIKPSFAYNVALPNKHFIAFGMQASFNQKKIDIGAYTTGSQWVANQGFDGSAGIGEDFEREQANYFGASTGVFWYKEDELFYRKHYAGVSVLNLNQPEQNFTGNPQRLPISYTFLGGYEFFTLNNQRVYAEVSSIYSKNEMLWSAGPRWSYRFKNNDPFDPFTSGKVDVFARYFSGDRLALGTQVDQKNFSVGFSVDLHLENSAQMASTEFSFSIFKRIGFKKEPKPQQTGGYELGGSREFKEEISFSDEPVSTIEREYKSTVTDDFSFELRKNFNYGFNETELNSEAKAYLDDIAVLLNSNPALKLKITGHTDNVGTEDANQIISEERAQKVANYLFEIGIAKERVQFEGKGASNPLFKNDTEENRSKNRRVEFLIYATKE